MLRWNCLLLIEFVKQSCKFVTVVEHKNTGDSKRNDSPAVWIIWFIFWTPLFTLWTTQGQLLVWKHTDISLIHFSAGMLDLHTSSAFQLKCTTSISTALNRLFNSMIGWKKTCRLEKEQVLITVNFFAYASCPLCSKQWTLCTLTS